mmetsp:Transcript_27489/g.69330  ORF Transcript_27489/g.69330 Transcript_27489/m.69330 type:complete len:312 (+) Transcript_27489:734-1669(+)
MSGANHFRGSDHCGADFVLRFWYRAVVPEMCSCCRARIHRIHAPAHRVVPQIQSVVEPRGVHRAAPAGQQSTALARVYTTPRERHALLPAALRRALAAGGGLQTRVQRVQARVVRRDRCALRAQLPLRHRQLRASLRVSRSDAQLRLQHRDLAQRLVQRLHRGARPVQQPLQLGHPQPLAAAAQLSQRPRPVHLPHGGVEVGGEQRFQALVEHGGDLTRLLLHVRLLVAERLAHHAPLHAPSLVQHLLVLLRRGGRHQKNSKILIFGRRPVLTYGSIISSGSGPSSGVALLSVSGRRRRSFLTKQAAEVVL